MPSFGVEGARSGYIDRRMLRRSEKIGAAMLTPQVAAFLASRMSDPAHGKANTDELGGSDAILRAASIGGAGGSDALGLALVLGYLGIEGVSIECTVFEYEPGWEEAVRALDIAPLMNGHSLSFAPCNLCLPVDDVANSAVLESAPSMDLVIVSYCLIENAVKLREGGFAFIRGLLTKVRRCSTLFLLMDSSWKLWGEISDIAGTCGYVSVYPWTTSCRNALLLVPAAYPVDPQAQGMMGVDVPRAVSTLMSKILWKCRQADIT
eukprot:CAMPEP_0114225518 /NCGR_PEP_ID=MMETSP0058-20121206/713_1 /TAXON_ID=36894 /ORGANISM="Pyramimonas parkeae, CCMP726" /LENGTH=263 /DNA_ID=CAMNT_0001336125 /DNA_START=585 /DNA_END=1376 /DNA_ORIENTATION=+